MGLEEEFESWDPAIVRLANLQPYFREYCREFNYRSAEEAKAVAGVEGFICWIGSKWLAWRNETRKQGCLSNEDHVAFSAWLPSKVDAEIKRITETPELNCHGLESVDD